MVHTKFTFIQCKSGGFDAADIDFKLAFLPVFLSITKDDAGVYTNLGWEAEIAGDIDGDGFNDLALVSKKGIWQKDGALHIYKRRTKCVPNVCRYYYALSWETLMN